MSGIVKIGGLLLILISVLSSWTFAQDQNRITVVASFSILADVVGEVAGDIADVSTLIGIGQDPHTYVPLTNDLVRLTEADVIFTNGAFFEEGLLESIENIQTDAPIEPVSLCVSMLAFADTHDDEHDVEHDNEHDDEHAEENDMHDRADSLGALCESYYDELALDFSHEEDDELGFLYELECAGHGGGDGEAISCDPHVWMDPENVMLWTLYIRDVLSDIDPANAATYATNAQAYIDQLRLLVEEITPAIATIPGDNRILVTNHETLGYLAHAYGLRLVDTLLKGGTTSAEPSPAELSALINIIRENNVPAVFAESTANSALIETAAAEAGVDVYELYTGSLSDADGPASTYIEYIRYNISIIVTALGGDPQF